MITGRCDNCGSTKNVKDNGWGVLLCEQCRKPPSERVNKVTDDWGKWSEAATELANKFRLAVDCNQRDDEFATAWDMMEFLQETVAALKSNATLEYDGHDGPDKEGWDD